MGILRAYIGIDPGQTGAVAVIVVDTASGAARAPELHDTPTFKGDGKTLYDEAGMARILADVARVYGGHVFATIEKVGAMPKQGVASSFNFGMGYGIWLGIIAALGIQSQRVTPQRWKKSALQDGPKVDQAVVAVAARLYPAVAAMLRGPRGALLMGRADALLIAQHGVTTYGANAPQVGGLQAPG